MRDSDYSFENTTVELVFELNSQLSDIRAELWNLREYLFNLSPSTNQHGDDEDTDPSGYLLPEELTMEQNITHLIENIDKFQSTILNLNLNKYLNDEVDKMSYIIKLLGFSDFESDLVFKTLFSKVEQLILDFIDNVNLLRKHLNFENISKIEDFTFYEN